MSNSELSTKVKGVGDLPNKFQGTDISDLSTGTHFLPRIQLFDSNSNHVKNGSINLAHYGIVRQGEDKPTDLGKQPVIKLLSWRPKAIRFGATGEVPLQSFRKESQRFQEIKAAADLKGQDNPNNYGLEFLVWLPTQQEFVTLMMGSATDRNDNPKFVAVYDAQGFATLGSRLIAPKNAKYSWHGKTITLTSTKHDDPDWNRAAKLVQSFQNQEDSKEPEKANPDTIKTDR